MIPSMLQHIVSLWRLDLICCQHTPTNTGGDWVTLKIARIVDSVKTSTASSVFVLPKLRKACSLIAIISCSIVSSRPHDIIILMQESLQIKCPLILLIHGNVQIWWSWMKIGTRFSSPMSLLRHNRPRTTIKQRMVVLVLTMQGRGKWIVMLISRGNMKRWDTALTLTAFVLGNVGGTDGENTRQLRQIIGNRSHPDRVHGWLICNVLRFGHRLWIKRDGHVHMVGIHHLRVIMQEKDQHHHVILATIATPTIAHAIPIDDLTHHRHELLAVTAFHFLNDNEHHNRQPQMLILLQSTLNVATVAQCTDHLSTQSPFTAISYHNTLSCFPSHATFSTSLCHSHVLLYAIHSSPDVRMWSIGHTPRYV